MLKKGLIKCFDVYGYSLDDNTLLFVDENMTNAGLSAEAEKVEIKNGQNNEIWSSLNQSKTLKVNLASNVIDMNKIAMLAGNALVSGAIEMYSTAKVYKIEETAHTITLDHEPKDGDSLQIIDVATDELIDKANYTVNSDVVDFTTGANVGEVKVAPYAYNELTGEELIIEADKFPTAIKLVMKTVFIDETGKVSKDVIIEIPKAVPGANWNLGSKTDFANPDDNSLELDCLPENGVLGRIKFVNR